MLIYAKQCCPDGTTIYFTANGIQSCPVQSITTPTILSTQYINTDTPVTQSINIQSTDIPSTTASPTLGTDKTTTTTTAYPNALNILYSNANVNTISNTVIGIVLLSAIQLLMQSC